MTKEKTDYFLPRRFTWMSRVSVQGLPVRPQTGDLGPVRDALQEVVDAAGGLEYSREALKRVMRSAQEEFLEAVRQMPSLAAVPVWGGTSTPSVYYEFYNAVAWTRAVDDRCRDRLKPAVQHDAALWTEVQRARSRSPQRVFEDARLLAKCSLHKFTPPYPLAGARVDGETLTYPVPEIVDAENFRANRLIPGRHVASLVETFWGAIERFVDSLLDVFHPPAASGTRDGPLQPSTSPDQETSEQ